MKKCLILFLAIMVVFSSHNLSMASSYALPIPVASPDNPFAAVDRSRHDKLVRSAHSRPTPYMTPLVRTPDVLQRMTSLQEKIKLHNNKSGGKYIVRFAADVSMQELFDLLLDEEYRLLGYSSERQIVLISDDIDAFLYKADGMIDYWESDQEMQVKTVNDPFYTDQWALRAIAAPAAWSYTTGNPGVGGEVTVAVIDSGITREHPDLINADIRDGYDYIAGGASRIDYVGHGTKVSGIIAAETNNMTGIAGICWNVALVPLAVVSEAGTASYTDLIQAIIDSADAGIDVINISLGGSVYLHGLADALAYANDRGCIVVASAGNAGTTAYMYPAANEYVIAVGSVDSDLNWSVFSAYHDRLDVCAPGQAVLTTSGSSGYAQVSGTSFAAPHVAGAAALAATLVPELTHDTFMNLLAKTSRDLGPIGYDYKHGYGLVDAGALAARLTSDFDVSVSGTAKFGFALSAQTSGSSHDENTVTYQWLRSGSPVSHAVTSRYMISADDIGQEITVQASAVTAAGLMTAVSTPVIPVKADRAVPDVPKLASKTDHSITLIAEPGFEYRLFEGIWQTGASFSGLKANTAYVLYARAAETNTHFASAASSALTVTTDKIPLSGGVTITGTLEFAGTLTADISAVKPAAATLAYTWKRGSAIIGTANQYTIVQDDIGKNITVLVSGTGSYSGSISSAPVVPNASADKTSKTITLAGLSPTTINIDPVHSVISGISLGTPVQAFISVFSEADRIRIISSAVQVSQSDLVGTGMLVQLMDGTLVTQELTAVVTGDITGNGQSSLTDFVQVRSHLLSKSILKGARASAADINGDGTITLTDFIRMKAHLLGHESIKPQQQTGESNR